LEWKGIFHVANFEFMWNIPWCYMRLSCDAKIRDKQQYEPVFGEEIWYYIETLFFFILS